MAVCGRSQESVGCRWWCGGERGELGRTGPAKSESLPDKPHRSH